LKVAAPTSEKFVIPITIAILVVLFLFQKHGTAKVGRLFGPITLVWFVVLAILGITHIIEAPGVLKALSPHYAVSFFVQNGAHGFVILGAVFLVVTGGEALYADIGHFGVGPIRLVWSVLVLPALLLNYMGQASLLLRRPEAAEYIFYNLAPSWALIPLVLLASAAAVIASQALITGAFSLTMQAVQLGFAPRLAIRHTSADAMGQIYLPMVNWALMLSCIALVVGFRSSSNLAAAYGISITSTMAITTILFYVVARWKWGWSPAFAALLCGLFVVIDLAFFGANVLKIAHGGWFPLVVASGVFLLMSTWRQGREVLSAKMAKRVLPLDDLLETVRNSSAVRVKGTAIFMSSSPQGTPPALLHNLKHNKVIHEKVVLLKVQMEEVPHVLPEERVSVEKLEIGFWRVIIRFGFMDDPNVPEALATAEHPEFKFEPMRSSYFLGRENLLAAKTCAMARWREALFAWMAQNSRDATSFFSLPPNSVVELGAQVEI
jgi:KUP system potassium uptake protein